MRPIITLAIPTYNRKSKLEAQLKHIYEHNFVNQEIEVIVSDNSSEDMTVQFLKEFSKRKLSFNWWSNSSNIGFDLNIKKLYEAAKGKYVWFISDDDVLVDGAIDYVVSIIKEISTVGLIIVPHLYKGKALVKEVNDLIPYNPVGIPIKVQIGSIGSTTSEEQRLNLILLASQLTGCIVQKIDIDFTGLRYGGLMHSLITNMCLLKNNNYFILRKGLIASTNRDCFSEWFMESTLFGIRELYIQLEMEFSERIVDIVTTQTCKFGLLLLKKRYMFKNGYVRYVAISKETINRFKSSYYDSYHIIEKDLLLALKAQDMRRFTVCVIRPIYLLKNIFGKIIKKIISRQHY